MRPSRRPRRFRHWLSGVIVMGFVSTPMAIGGQMGWGYLVDARSPLVSWRHGLDPMALLLSMGILWLSGSLVWGVFAAQRPPVLLETAYGLGIDDWITRMRNSHRDTPKPGVLTLSMFSTVLPRKD